jgi:hypothetical protein
VRRGEARRRDAHVAARRRPALRGPEAHVLADRLGRGHEDLDDGAGAQTPLEPAQADDGPRRAAPVHDGPPRAAAVTAEADPAHARAGRRLHEQAGDADAAAQDAPLEADHRERAHEGRRRRQGRRGRRRRRDRRGRQRGPDVDDGRSGVRVPAGVDGHEAYELAAGGGEGRRDRRPERVEDAVAVEVPQDGGQPGRAGRGRDREHDRLPGRGRLRRPGESERRWWPGVGRRARGHEGEAGQRERGDRSKTLD